MEKFVGGEETVKFSFAYSSPGTFLRSEYYTTRVLIREDKSVDFQIEHNKMAFDIHDIPLLQRFISVLESRKRDLQKADTYKSTKTT